MAQIKDLKNVVDILLKDIYKYPIYSNLLENNPLSESYKVSLDRYWNYITIELPKSNKKYKEQLLEDTKELFIDTLKYLEKRLNDIDNGINQI